MAVVTMERWRNLRPWKTGSMKSPEPKNGLSEPTNANYPNRHRSPRSRLADRKANYDAGILSADAQRANAGVQSEKQPQSGHFIQREPGRASARQSARKESRLRFPRY